MADGSVKIDITADDGDVKKKLKDTEGGLGGLGEKSKETQEELDKTADKFKELTETVAKQEKELSDLKDEYAQAVVNFGKGSAEVKELEDKISALNSDLAKNQSVLDEASDAAEKLTASNEDLGSSAKSAGEGVSVATVAMGNFIANGLTALASKIGDAVSSIVSLAEETREYRGEMAKLETAFKESAVSTDSAKNAYTELYSVLGDEGQSVEAAGHLAKLVNSEEELAQWTEICTGVYSEFGASLPVEGLTEAANETAKVGQVTGGLADALNWSTMQGSAWKEVLSSNKQALAAFNKATAEGASTEDAFNEALSKCSTEQERAALITDTLSMMYGNSAEAFRENNASIIDANRATAELTEAQASLGASIEPLTTMYKSGLAEALQGLSPHVNTITQGLQDMFNGVDGGSEKLSTGISGLIESVMSTINTMLPNLLTAGVEIINGLVTGISSSLPTLIPLAVQAVSNLVTGLMNALPALIQGASTLISEIASALPGLMETIVSALPGAIQAIVSALPPLIPTVITGIVTAFTTLVSSIDEIIQPLIDALPDIIISIVQALVANLPAIIEGLIQLTMAIVAALPQILQALVDALPTVISLIVTALLENLPVIIEGLGQVIMGVVEALPQILTALVEGVVNIFSGIWDGLENVFGNSDEWFGGKFGKAKDAIKGVFQDIGEWFSGIWEDIKAVFSVVADVFGEFFSAAWDAITSVFSVAAEWFGGMFSTAWEGITVVWDAVTGYFEGIWDSITGIFDAVKSVLSGNFEDAWNAIKGVIDTWKQYFSDIWDGIKGVFSAVGTWFGDTFTAAKDAIVEAFSNIKETFGKVKDRIFEAFNNIKDKFLKVGDNIVSGIWSGISNGLKWIKDKISGWVGSVLDFCKKLLGIKSPSRVFRDEVGAMISEGMAVGIEDNEDKPAKAVQGVFGTMRKVLEEEKKKTIHTVADYNKEIETLEIEHGQERQRIEQETNDAILAAEKDCKDKLVELEEKFKEDKRKENADILKLEKEYNKNVEKTKETAQQKIIDLNAKYDKAIESENEKHAEKVGKIQDNIKNTIEGKIQEIITLEEKYKEDTKAVFDELGQSIDVLVKNYDEQLASRTASIADSLNIWDKVEREKISGNVLISNLRTQTAALENYNDAIAELEGRNLNPEFLNALKSMGVGAVDEIEAIAEMTDKQLETYVTFWERKNKLAREAATEELEPLKAETEAQIEVLTNAALDKYSELRTKYAEQSSLLMAELKQAMIDAGNGGYEELIGQIDEYTSAGEDLMSGVIAGIVDKSPAVVSAVKNAVKKAIQAAKDAAGIASPSKVMKKDVGANLAEGINVGWADRIGAVKSKMTADMQGITSRIKTAVSLENEKMALGVGVRDTGFAEVAQAVGMQTAGINSLASEFRSGSTAQVTVPLVLDGRELGRAIVELGSAETTRTGASLSYA